MKNNQIIAEKLLQKSMEAFILAIEIYNKPTIRYRSEGTSLFLCNAWELMLKSFLIKTEGIDSIYYSNSQGRTISLEDSLKRIFTNENDPLRVNMRKIIDFRNTNTHFITEEYEIIYGPLFQSSIINFSNKISELHGINTNDYLPDNYLSLSVNRSIVDEEKIKAKYPPEIAYQILKSYNDVAQFPIEVGENLKYASYYETSLAVVKNPKNADLKVKISSDSEVGIAIAKEIQTPGNKYPYTTKQAIDTINQRLKRLGLKYQLSGENKDRFTQYDWQLFSKFYDFKGNSQFSYDRSLPREKNKSYIYSESTIILIVQSLKENPSGCLDSLKQQLKK